MKNSLKMTLILFAVCAIAGGTLAFVYKITKPKIEERAEVEKISALKEVMPDATRFDTTTIPDRWIAYKENQKIGDAIGVTVQGYGGPIHIIFGVDKNKKVTKIKIIEQNETPGLGAKISEKKFLGQFEGKNQNEVVIKKDDPQNGKIDAISGATISSRAVTNAIHDAMENL